MKVIGISHITGTFSYAEVKIKNTFALFWIFTKSLRTNLILASKNTFFDRAKASQL